MFPNTWSMFPAHQNEMMESSGLIIYVFFQSKCKYQSSALRSDCVPGLRQSLHWGLPPTPRPSAGNRLPGVKLSNTSFTFYLLLNYLYLPFDEWFILRNNVILVYNSTFLVDCCVEFCEKYLRRGLYCINKFFVSCELWVETDIPFLFLLQLT